MTLFLFILIGMFCTMLGLRFFFSRKRISLPKDVKDRINKDFTKNDERKYIEKELVNMINRPLNVGGEQLSRSILFLSNGNIEAFKNVMSFGDPRDVLVKAEDLNGNPGHYFTIPFE